MVAVGPVQVAPLFQQIIDQFSLPRLDASPDGQLWLQVDTLQISCLEAGLRWAPGVKAIVIDAILLCHSEVMPPALHIHGCVAGQREDASVVFPSEKGDVSVDGEVFACCSEIPQTEVCLLHVLSLLRL